MQEYVSVCHILSSQRVVVRAHPASDAVNALVLPEHLCRIGIILPKLFDDIRAGIAKLLLYFLGDSELVLWRDD